MNRRYVRMTILFSSLFSFNNDLFQDATSARESRDPAHVLDTVVIILMDDIISLVLTWYECLQSYIIVHIGIPHPPETHSTENYVPTYQILRMSLI